MKKIIGLLLIFSVIAGCTSSKKYLQRRQYDAAINKSVKKLAKKPSKTKQINVLRDAYRLANLQDNDRIKFLKQSGQPDIWDEVFVRLNNMKVRQENVKRLPTGVLAKINFVPVDYDAEIITAKQKAAEYFYAHATNLLNRKEKFAARQAYDEFRKVKNYYSSYKDVDKKINEAYEYGMNYVFFKMQNKSGIAIPKNFERDLLKISLTNIAGKWVTFETKESNILFYDYSIYLNLNIINVSPEYVKEKEYVESKKVQDGYEYVLDKNGNVMKDSLGKDIKVPKYVEKKCYVTEYYLNKKAIVSGTLDFWNNRTKQLVKTDPVTTEFFFEHRFADVKGDKSVLKKETLRLVKTRPLPFPPDLDMIYRTNEKLKEMTKSIIVRNRSLVEN